MAYLTFTGSEESQNTCFKFIGTSAPTENTTHLISDNVSLITPSVSEGGNDVCTFYSGPSDAAIMAFGESCESTGSIAYSGSSSESCGSIAYSGGGESCGSVASASVSSGSSSGGGCSYSC